MPESVVGQITRMTPLTVDFITALLTRPFSRDMMAIIHSKPMSKSSSSASKITESHGWWDRDMAEPSEWTYEGSPND
jgi:hypothetical protein